MPALPRLISIVRSSRPLGAVLAACCATMLAVGLNTASAQLPLTRLTAIHPSGGQRGTTVDLSLTNGTDLEEIDQLYFSHPGIKAAPKSQMVDGQPRPIANQFVVTIAPDVPVGLYDLRAHGLFGLSNPRTFSVGDRTEALEVEPNNTPEQSGTIELGTIVNGRSDGGADIDWYKIKATAGQRLIVSLQGSRIDSRMEGALELYQGGRRIAHQRMKGRQEPLIDFKVPADGEYLLKVFDFVYGGGPEYFYRLSLSTAPQIDFILPASGLPNATGEYTLYGRNLPGGQPAALKAADGVELEQLKLQIATVADPATFAPGDSVLASQSGVDGIAYSLNSSAGTSNAVTIFFASAATALEHEPNDALDQAQKLTLPVEITGQFQKKQDVDTYQFDAKAGDVYWIEVFSQRGGASADPVMVIDQVKKNDKGEETVTRIKTTAGDGASPTIGGQQFNTSSDDPAFRFVAPADAAFRVTVRDRAFENRGDPSLVYRLSLRKETPDFRLVALPVFPSTDANLQQNTWDMLLRKGDNAHLSVMAFRRDGFAGPIDVAAEGLPPGVTCPGATIGPGQLAANLVFSSTEQAADWFGAIRIVGRASIDDPATAKALTDAEAARTAAVAALPALDKAVADATAPHKTAADQAKAAGDALAQDPNNEGLKKAKTDADAALAKAAATLNMAVEAQAAGQKKIADSQAAVAQARSARKSSARETVREARSGTIVWSGNPGAQQPAHSRLARSITLSVNRETAPYQLLSDVTRVSVNQGSQVLIPMRLLKRAGFDANVNLTFVAPPQNVQVENKPINKGVNDQVYRVFVQNNAPVGTYTLFVQSQSQISYSRNPEAAARAALEKETADKLAAGTAEAARLAAEAKTAADKKATDTAAAAKVAAEAKLAADKLAVDAEAAAKLAAEEKVKADKLAADAAEAAKKAADEKTAAEKAATDTAAAAKVAADAAVKAKTDLDNDANNETLKKAKADADAALVKADAEAKKAVDAKTAADKKAADTAEAAKKADEAKAVSDKKAADAAEAAKKAAEAKVVADKAAVDADAASKLAVDEKAAADKLAAETDAKSKAAAAAKAAADKKATDTANVSKPQNVNAFFPATPVVVQVRTAPGTLALTVPNNGSVARGANLEVKVVINRANGFAGPVTLSLPLPPGVAGLSAESVTIPADKNEGVLLVQASGEATQGALANLVVRASMEFDGPSSIDQPIAITVP